MNEKLIYVFIPFNSMEEFEKLEHTLHQDKKFQKTGEDYLNAKHDDPPYKRIESILLRSFKSFPVHGKPKHSTPSPSQIYELRSYENK